MDDGVSMTTFEWGSTGTTGRYALTTAAATAGFEGGEIEMTAGLRLDATGEGDIYDVSGGGGIEAEQGALSGTESKVKGGRFEIGSIAGACIVGITYLGYVYLSS